MQTILVTGVSGFIGSSLAEKIINRYQVIGLDNFNDYYSPKIKENNISNLKKNKNFKIYKGDILDNEILEKIFKENEIDKIVHLAARAGVRPSLINPQLYMSVNFLGTQKVLDFAVKNEVKQFIFASSSSVYGNNSKIPFSENNNLEKPISPYAISKIAGEKLCWLYNNTCKLPTTVLRFFSVYGPKGRPDMAPYIFTKKILNNEEIEVYGDGSQARDFTYIDDIVSGIIKSLSLKTNFETINLGNSFPTTVSELIKTIELSTGEKAKVKYLANRLGDVERTYADISKAKKLLNWEPKIKIHDGIKKFISSWTTK
jgi:UDP-glucuronate 4-epimerase